MGAASVTSEDRLEAAHLRLTPLTSGPLSPGSETETRHQAHRSKKMRTTFTGRQIFIMEKMFESKKYLNATERSHLSRELCVTEQQVKIWFQNRRTKWKKQENLGIGLTKKIEDVGVEDKGILDDNNDRIKSDNLKLENDTTNTKLLKPSESLKCSSLEISRM